MIGDAAQVQYILMQLPDHTFPVLLFWPEAAIYTIPHHICYHSCIFSTRAPIKVFSCWSDAYFQFLYACVHHGIFWEDEISYSTIRTGRSRELWKDEAFVVRFYEIWRQNMITCTALWAHIMRINTPFHGNSDYFLIKSRNWNFFLKMVIPKTICI